MICLSWEKLIQIVGFRRFGYTVCGQYPNYLVNVSAFDECSMLPKCDFVGRYGSPFIDNPRIVRDCSSLSNHLDIWLWIKTLLPRWYPKIAGIAGCLFHQSYGTFIGFDPSPYHPSWGCWFEQVKPGSPVRSTDLQGPIVEIPAASLNALQMGSTQR